MKTVGSILETIEMTLRKDKRGSLKKSQIQTAIRVGINNFFDKQLQIYRMSGGMVPTPLRQFVKSATITITNSVGTAPTDMAIEQTFYVANTNSNPAEFLARDVFEERKNSVILPPTELDPIGTLELGNILVRPQNLTEIIFTYIKRPAEISIGTQPSIDGRELEYVDNTTVDTEFSIEYAPDIIKEALMFLGVPQQDGNAVSLAETTKI
jgi:hypothetical protein